VTFNLTVTGLRGTIYGIDVAVALTVAKATAALEAGARLVQAAARANVEGRKYTGRLSDSITVAAPDLSVAESVTVAVGVQPGVWAPEGFTFEFGWRSKTGKRPPVAPLAAWALAKGIVGTEAEAKSFGFLVSRAMGARPGYSFGQTHWLANASRDTVPAVAVLVKSAMP
jgi:Bacteriophage HK97-gp10, putative tail-component